MILDRIIPGNGHSDTNGAIDEDDSGDNFSQILQSYLRYKSASSSCNGEEGQFDNYRSACDLRQQLSGQIFEVWKALREVSENKNYGVN